MHAIFFRVSLSLTHTHTHTHTLTLLIDPPPPPKYCSSSSSSTSATVMTFWDMDRAHAGRPPAAVQPNSKTTGYRLTLTLFHGSAAAMHMQQLRYFASPRHAQTSYFSGGGTLASFRKNTQQLIRPPERYHCLTASVPSAAHYAYNTLSIVNTAIQIQRLKASENNLMYLLAVSLSDTKYTTLPRFLKLNVFCLCNKFNSCSELCDRQSFLCDNFVAD